ncbi:MAG: hypothetical protein JKY48_16290 [Flavobacteriales bacterium]|nr:hypothetical protein [Flavobacteriales bacterium]
MKKIFFLFLLFFGIQLVSFGQAKKINFIGIESLKLSTPKQANDSLSAIQIAREVLQGLHDLSFLSANIDSIKWLTKEIIVYLSPGEKYKWVRLRKGNLSQQEIDAIDFSSRVYLGRPFNAKQLQNLFKKTIQHFENNGYPFASISLDSVSILEKTRLKASLHLEKNKKYLIDSIKITGNSGIDKDYLSTYLGIYEGMLYNESKISNIDTRVREIPFITAKQRPQIHFFENSVKIILDLKKKKASRFDGIIGLLTNEGSGKIEFTGDVDLNLINAFNKGENFGLNWRKLKGNSQDLNIDFLYPYLFKTPFALDFDFKLYKQDTTFLDLETRLGINYLLERGEYVSLFIENKSSTLLSRSTFLNTINPQIPSLGDLRINSFGIAYAGNKTDYKYNPTKGMNFNLLFSAGIKRLKKITELEEEQPNIYTDVELKTNQYKGKLKAEFYIPIKSRSTIKAANQSATIYSENIYANELLRIGGLKILRGFDEESIKVSSYSIFTLEYRFLLDRNSYFSIFGDQGIYESRSENGYNQGNPFGIGAGVSFETKAGIFTFNYAVGKQLGNPIEVRAAKIHFGFVNFF